MHGMAMTSRAHLVEGQNVTLFGIWQRQVSMWFLRSYCRLCKRLCLRIAASPVLSCCPKLRP